MPSSIKNIVDGFLFPTIDPIVRTPDYESIADIHLKLNLNAASVQSNLGCGTLGLLFLTVLPAVYATLYTIPFVPPVNPGPEPRIPTGTTGAVITDLRYRHTEATKIFTEYKNTDKALLLEGPGTHTYVRAPYRISFRYPVHSPRHPASWYPNGPCITRVPNRWLGVLASIHVIYYMLLLIGKSRSMRTLFATTHHETIPSRLPHSLPRTTFTKQFLHITVDSLNSSK